MSRTNGDDFEPVDLGTDDPGGDVALVKTDHGAIFIPVSLRRLNGYQADVVSDLQAAAIQVHQAQKSVTQLVDQAREVGVSWAVIGWSVGTTGEAARQRWGD